MNNIESLNIVDELSNEKKVNLFETEYGKKIHQSFREILVKYNVAKPRLTYYKDKISSIEFNLNYLFGFSEKEYQDFSSCYEIYLERIPDSMLAIGSVDGGDLLCMDNDSGEIYYWFHEEHDWGLEGNHQYPIKVSSSLENYLDMLVVSELPTKEEIEIAKKEGRRISITPIGLDLLNKDRATRGLAPLTMEEALANKRDEEFKKVESEGRTTYTSDDFDDLFAEYLVKK